MGIPASQVGLDYQKIKEFCVEERSGIPMAADAKLGGFGVVTGLLKPDKIVFDVPFNEKVFLETPSEVENQLCWFLAYISSGLTLNGCDGALTNSGISFFAVMFFCKPVCNSLPNNLGFPHLQTMLLDDMAKISEDTLLYYTQTMGEHRPIMVRARFN